MTDERHEFVVEAAWLHHEFGLTQDEIARRFGVSRSTVSRALADAERQGIVQVVVTVPLRREAHLAAALGEHLGVMATVGARVGDETSTAAAARAAARLLERLASAGRMTIAASWGRTLAATAQLVRPRVTTGVTVVDAVGYAAGERMVPAVEVTRTLAASLGASVVHLPSPAFVDSASWSILMSAPTVADALATARAADVTLVSIGIVGEESLLLQEGLVSAAVMDRAASLGAAGEILGHWYDGAGHDVEADGAVPVGLSLNDLRKARRAIGVAGGGNKAGALRAALAGGIVREIVVDDELAERLLAEASGATPTGSPSTADLPDAAVPEAAPREATEGETR